MVQQEYEESVGVRDESDINCRLGANFSQKQLGQVSKVNEHDVG